MKSNEEVAKLAYEEHTRQSSPKLWSRLLEADRVNIVSFVTVVRKVLGLEFSGKQAPADDALVEADRFLRHVAGLDLSRLSISDQRETRERVWALQRALRP